jgi:transcriptional regulator with XRE-family HTH domain
MCEPNCAASERLLDRSPRRGSRPSYGRARWFRCGQRELECNARRLPIRVLPKTKRSKFAPGLDWQTTRLESSNNLRLIRTLHHQVTAATRPSPARILTVVSKVSGVPPETVLSPNKARNACQVRAVAAHLLRVDASLEVRQVGVLLGRSRQTVWNFDRNARVALANGGHVAELIDQARRALATGSQDPTPESEPISRLPPPLEAPPSMAMPKLRHWRERIGLTQAELALKSSVARETIARIESGRLARHAVVLRRAVALLLTPSELALSTDSDVPTGEPNTEVPATRSSCMALPSLRHWRTQMHLTQPQLVQRAGIARETVARIECGRPARHAAILRLASALLVAPSELTARSELDDRNAGAYKQCESCGATKPERAFVQIKGTPYFYLRCRVCRAKRAKERYWADPLVFSARDSNPARPEKPRQTPPPGCSLRGTRDDMTLIAATAV